MTEYGIIPTGFNRKPLAVILAEFEAKFITEYGPQVIQTAQSPLGQLNGLMADIVTQLWEESEDLYQSYDPDQADGRRLDILGRLRLVSRNGGLDSTYRQRITNAGQGRIDIQDLAQAIASISGVTYSRVFINETGEVLLEGLAQGTIALAVMGGADEDIAEVLRLYVAPGVNTYGNTYVTSNVDGFCRSMSVIRPTIVEVAVEIRVKRTTDQLNCPPPSVAAIKNQVEATWLAERSNGLDPSFYTVRSIIERAFSNVEVLTVEGTRAGEGSSGVNVPVNIGFLEIANLTAEIIPV